MPSRKSASTFPASPHKSMNRLAERPARVVVDADGSDAGVECEGAGGADGNAGEGCGGAEQEVCAAHTAGCGSSARGATQRSTVGSAMRR
ncbi:unnamed protein product [Closterium sp. NIES-54]